MTSRRDSLAKLDTKLKALAKRIPEGTGLYNLLSDIGEPNAPGAVVGTRPNADHPHVYDRSAAISVAAYIDHVLKTAICSHFRSDVTASELKELFSDRGPLGSLSAKIAMARSLGVVDQSQREVLDTIRTIRNSFAHSMSAMTFEDSEVASLCQTLPVSLDEELRPKLRFVLAVADIFSKLVFYPRVRGAAVAPLPSPDIPK